MDGPCHRGSRAGSRRAFRAPKQQRRRVPAGGLPSSLLARRPRCSTKLGACLLPSRPTWESCTSAPAYHFPPKWGDLVATDPLGQKPGQHRYIVGNNRIVSLSLILWLTGNVTVEFDRTPPR